MKKALLTGVAALLLTGAAHADTERACPARKLADGAWNYAEVKECMARISQTIPNHEAGYWVWKYFPPPEFDKPYKGILAIFRLPFADVEKFCAGLTKQHACSFIKQSVPFQKVGDRTVCYIIMPTDDDVAQYRGYLGYHETPNDIIRHEIGHCNGWPADHPNRNARLEWVEK